MLGYTAVKRSPTKHEFAFGFSDLPSANDVVIDGDSAEGELDGNGA